MSGFVDSSSYDTGLDRLGMPRRISKEEPVAIARAIAAEVSEQAQNDENRDEIAPRRQPQSPKSEAESNRENKEDGYTKSLSDSKAETAKSVETTGQTTPTGSPIPALRHLPSARSPSPGPVPKPRPRSQISAASAASRLTHSAMKKAQNYPNTEKERDSSDSEAAPGSLQAHHLETKDVQSPDMPSAYTWPPPEHLRKPRPPISPKPYRKILPNSDVETDIDNTKPDN